MHVKPLYRLGLLTVTFYVSGALPVAASNGEAIAFADPVVSHENYTHVTDLTIHTDLSGTFNLRSQAGDRHVRLSTSDPSEPPGLIHYPQGFQNGGVTIVPGEYTVSIDLGRGIVNGTVRDAFETFDLRLTTPAGLEIGERVVIEEYVHPEVRAWTTVTVSYSVEAGHPAVGQPLTWQAEYGFPVDSENDLLGAIDNVAGYLIPDPDYEPTDPYLVASDPIGNPQAYTHESVSGIATEWMSDEFGLVAQAGSAFINHRAGGGMRDVETTLGQGFDPEHTLEPGLYLATIDVGRGVVSPGREGFSTVAFSLVTLGGEEIAEPKIIDAYNPPAEGEWTTVGVAYFIDEDHPHLGEPITWRARLRHLDPHAGLFGALDNARVRHLPDIGDVVATEDMSSSSAYEMGERPVIIQRDPFGAYQLEATAGLSYIRYGGRFTQAERMVTELTDGFESGHTVQPGTYTAMIDLGRAGEILGRDGFAAFDFRLMTVGGGEVGERRFVRPYFRQPGLGQWTTKIVTHTVPYGDPAVGETLTWRGEGYFSNSNAHKFGATDNVVVYFQPIDGEEPQATSFAEWQSEQFGDQEDPAITGPDAAPAGDGVANLLKYAFGLDAMTPVGADDLPQAEMENDTLALTYLERHSADIAYIPEMSSDLDDDWDAGNVQEISRTQVDADFDRVTVEAVLPDGAQRGFLRVNVTRD